MTEHVLSMYRAVDTRPPQTPPPRQMNLSFAEIPYPHQKMGSCSQTLCGCSEDFSKIQNRMYWMNGSYFLQWVETSPKRNCLLSSPSQVSSGPLFLRTASVGQPALAEITLLQLAILTFCFVFKWSHFVAQTNLEVTM